MASRPRVLFLCTGNSCRSQMAEGLLRDLCGEHVTSLSAGTDPHGLNRQAIRAMAEIGIDISSQTSDSIEAYLEDPPELVITVCDSAAANCPTLPGATRVLHWPFDDPAGATGTEAEVFGVFRRVRNEIRERLEAWIREGCPPLSLTVEQP